MSSTLLILYASIHLVSAVIAGFLGYWALARTQMRSKLWFGALMTALVLWALTSTAELILSGQASQSAAKLLYIAVGLTVALLWLLFTADYTYRSIQTNNVVLLLGAVYLLVLVTALTNPLHQYYASFTIHQTPFSHTEIVSGPARVLGVTYILTSTGVGVYYLGSLFERGRSQVSTPTAVLAGTVLLGSLPFLAAVLGFQPVGTYDHTPFGITVFLLGVGYVVFRYDFYDLSPIARDIVLQEANDAMFVLDSESRLVDHNTAAREIVPDLAEESTGSPLSDLHAELARVADELQEGNQRELRLSFDGVSRHFSAQASNITVNSESIGTVLFLRDITERQRREQQLERQNDRLDQFASMVSHDLRNPLNVAQLRTELVTEEYDDNNAQMAQEALDRMETMIDEMLHLARAGQDIETTEQCRLTEPVQRAWASVPTADSTLETHVNGTTVVADPSRLSQVFENLFRNALEHNEKPPAVRVGTLTSGDGFYIEDDGDGIPEDERNDIFDHGYTTTEGGSGLGLAIVSDVVEAHGWSITATESEDGGARFEIRTD